MTTNTNTDSIYREELMEHYKDPQNRGSLSNFDVEVNEVNPFCGDNIKLQLQIKDNKIENVAFDGSACAVSVASASLVTEFIKGKTLAQAEELTKDDVLDMLGVELTTSRVKCATLVLDALKHSLEEYYSKHPKTSKKTVEKITKDSNIAQLVMKYPQVAEVLLDYGLHCVGCFANSFDSLEAGAKIHGFTEEEVDDMVTRINEVVEFGE